MQNSPIIYELGSDFYDEVAAAKFPQAHLRFRNQDCAKLLGLSELSESQWQAHFWEFQPFNDNIKTPLALRYHGHQFQHYNPDLGDGRGFLFAQFQTAQGIIDLGTKGSGTTPYSRAGDGRLTLKGAVREALATELLEALQVPTSRTLSIFETGESLERHDEPSPTRAAVLVRASLSHIRFGTFQRLAYFQQKENMLRLLNYCVKHYYPHLVNHAPEDLPRQFLYEVQYKMVQTVAAWMMAGFVHGVLNTDNMNITGESFDYGPYRFIPKYDPNFTAAYFDHGRLYAFGRQPHAVLWNLYQLADSLRLLDPSLYPEKVYSDFGDLMGLETHQALLRRLNLKNPLLEMQDQAELNQNLLRHFFQFIVKENVSFEQAFFDLHSKGSTERWQRSPHRAAYESESFKDFLSVLSSFEIADIAKSQHTYFTGTACSLLIDEIESIWSAIAQRDDWSLFNQKIESIRRRRGL